MVALARNAIAALTTATAFLSISALGPSQNSEGPVRSTLDSKAISILIGKLKSRNADPNPMGRPLVGFPASYDVTLQKQVWDARHQLKSVGKDAFPMLIQHLNDKAYSLSISTSILRSFSVGDVCFSIIEDQVDLGGESYKSRMGSDGELHPYRSYFSKYCDGMWYTKEGIQRWWNDHQHSSLRNIQIEALRKAIDRERAIGFPSPRDKELYLDPLVAKLNSLLNP